MGTPSNDHHQLQPGNIIVYLLRPDQYPTNSHHEWRGKITHYFPEQHLLIVEILNEGYDHETEPIYFDQIIRVEETREQPAREEEIWYGGQSRLTTTGRSGR
jgi:hypothetical protein